MDRPDPRWDALLERIVEGEDAPPAEPARAHDSVAENLLLLSGIDRFHRRAHTLAGEEDDSQGTLVTSGPASEPEAGPSPTAPPRRWGQLEIRGRLGRGGFSEVFRAWDASLQREVALKLLRPDIRARRDVTDHLLREARILAKVRHENVVTVYGVETHDDQAGYWMELVEGEDLEERLHAQGPMNAEEGAQVGLVLCRALAALHRAGLVHRDVKTSNVVRERGGRLVLMDFGTVIGSASASDRPPPLSGTPLYMAPETLHGAAPDRRSDIYSLGVLLYRLVTDDFPLDPMPLDALLDAHEQGRRRLLRDARPDLPPGFCAVVDRALDPDPEARFQTVGELERALAGEPRTAPAQPRRRWLLAMLLAAMVLGAAWLLRPSGRGGLVVDAAFHALRADGRAIEVGDGAEIAVGDALWLELTPSLEAYLYVLNRDRHGEVNLLFPLTGYDLKNPLPAGEVHELPGRAAGARKAWRVSSDGGREEFLIVASPEPLTAFETSLAQLPQAGGSGTGTSLALGRAQLGELVRGVAETIDLPAEGATAEADIFEAARRLGAPGASSGVWVRKVTLVHGR